MSKPKKQPNSAIVIRHGLNIGELAAEDDADFLKDAFIRTPILDVVTELGNPKSIILGRTGSGKTALLSHISKVQPKVYMVVPKEVSLNYISNSNIIRFFTELGVDLDLFYQLLWRHVIAVELIRQRYAISSEAENRSFLRSISDAIFADERKKEAIEYLKKWQSKFWINWDARIQELTTTIENELKASATSEIPGLTFEVGAATKLGSEEKTQLVRRAQAVVNSVQIAELSRVIDLLSEYVFSDNMRYYLVIDDLDEKWVDEAIRFKLIRALIETIKVFRRVSRVKIIVALRVDILERVYYETRDIGFQLDKYDGYMARIKWTDKELKDLVQFRIRSLYKKQYTKDDANFQDLFKFNVGQIEPLDYIISRTLMRPRDVIAFVNECLIIAEGKAEITAQLIRDAELPYSQKRLNAIKDEWQSVHPNLNVGIEFLANKKDVLTFGEIAFQNAIEDIAIKVTESHSKSSDEIHEAARAVFESATTSNMIHFAKLIISILYKVGLVGIKNDQSQHYNYSYLHAATIPVHLVSDDCKIRIHPMFWRALGTRP